MWCDVRASAFSVIVVFVCWRSPMSASSSRYRYFVVVLQCHVQIDFFINKQNQRNASIMGINDRWRNNNFCFFMHFLWWDWKIVRDPLDVDEGQTPNESTKAVTFNYYVKYFFAATWAFQSAYWNTSARVSEYGDQTIACLTYRAHRATCTSTYD